MPASRLDTGPFVFRAAPCAGDPGAVREIVASSGFFNDAEIAVAVELVEERLKTGESCGYHFLFAERDGRVCGYTCFGPIPCTASSFDLYWIAVHEDSRGTGLGRELMVRSEEMMRTMGAERVYIETSSRAQYQPTQGFYLRCGYVQAACFADFYAPGDGKIVYVRTL